MEGDDAAQRSGVTDLSSTVAHHAESAPPSQLVAEQSSSTSDATEQRSRVRLDSNALRRRKLQRQREQSVYKVSAIAASLGISSLAVAAVWYRFVWHLNDSGGEFPVGEAAATLLLTLGGAVGMEMWARYAHKALWHDFEPGWSLHKSHHEPRVGPFEDNDFFALVNAIPAMGLCAYGFVTPHVVGGLCFGAGLGITLFGISYMFIHDGLVHKRFPVGPIADVPYLKRVAIAHKLHHSEKYLGVPWGLFLGPHELDQVGGTEELDRMVAEHDLAAAKRR